MHSREPAKTLFSADLNPGDVLLCRPDGWFSISRRIITWKTKSKYTHAAIYIGEDAVLEAVRPAVRKVKLAALLKRYAHVAVFRQPDAWDASRIAALNLFASKAIIFKARYNLAGALSISRSQIAHNATIHERLEEYFKNPTTLAPPLKASYFCSEIVVDTFIATGFIDPSAAEVFQGHTYTPGGLSKEAAFGTFHGYLTSRRCYRVAASDEFYNVSTYREIFGRTAP